MGTRSRYSRWIEPSATRTSPNYQNGNPLPSVSTHPGYYELTTIGEDIPNFHKRKKRGELLPHTVFEQYEKSPYLRSSYDVRLERSGNPNEWWESEGLNLSHFATPSIYHAPDTSSASYFVQSAAAEIYSNGFDALTAIAELGDVKRMFRQASKSIQKWYKRGYNQDNITEAISGAYLGYRYGVRPLISDMQSLYEAVTAFDSEREIWSQRNGTSYTVADTVTNSVYIGNVWGTWDYEESYVTTHSIRGSVTARFQPARINTNLAVTGWELVPFSFMVDWALSIGKAIQANSLALSAEEIVASTGVKSTTVYKSSVSGFNPKAGYDYVRSNGATLGWTCTRSARSPTVVPTKPQWTQRKIDTDLASDLWALGKMAVGDGAKLLKR